MNPPTFAHHVWPMVPTGVSGAIPAMVFYSVVNERLSRVWRLVAEASLSHVVWFRRDVDSIIPYPCVLSTIIFEMFAKHLVSSLNSCYLPTHMPIPPTCPRPTLGAPDGGIDRSARSHRVE